MRPRFLLVPLVLLSACDDDDDGGGFDDPIPVFVEQEPNDVPAEANDFGVLQVGDRFFIDGFVRDDVAGGFVDPFDAFLFTAGEPLHVDFALFIAAPGADLDVCLFDPQLGTTVECFATGDDPELGGVDVTAGGLDFHLVVESFAGDSAYSLEIDVQPLFAASSDDGTGPRIRATGARSIRSPRAERDYPPRRERPVVELEQHLWLDPRSGEGFALVRVKR